MTAKIVDGKQITNKIISEVKDTGQQEIDTKRKEVALTWAS